MRIALCLILVFGLSACTLQQKLQQAADNYDSNKDQMLNKQSLFSKALSDKQAKVAQQNINKPWVAGKAMPLARELSLPLPLRNKVKTTLLFTDGDTNLKKIARRISAVTGIPIVIKPDALLPASSFLPKLANNLQNSIQHIDTEYEQLDISITPEPLAQILDRLCAHFGIRWRYENQKITFYRVETRVFNLNSLSLDAKSQISLGLGRAENEGGYVSSSSTSLHSAEENLIQAIRAKIEPFLSQAGVMVAQPGAGATVVITDVPDVLDNIARYLEQENRSLTRRVRLVFEELTVALNEQDQASIDWNLVFAGVSVVAGVSLPGLANESASSIGLGVVNGKLTGSEAIVQALGESVKLLRHSSIPMMTLNRRPVTHAVRKTFSYIDRIETTPVAGANGLSIPAVSVNQKEETVGSLLTLVPDVQEDGRILLSLAYDSTVAQPLKSVTFGDKSNPLQLQQLTIEGNGTVQQFALQAGQPLVISGFDRNQEQATKKRLGAGLPAIFGGGDALSRQRLTTILVITAQIEEGL